MEDNYYFSGVDFFGWIKIFEKLLFRILRGFKFIDGSDGDWNKNEREMLNGLFENYLR